MFVLSIFICSRVLATLFELFTTALCWFKLELHQLCDLLKHHLIYRYVIHLLHIMVTLHNLLFY